MLKKVTEPQAQYFKDHPSDGSGSASETPAHTSMKKTKVNRKMVGGLLAVALFLVVGVAGFLIIGKQREAQIADKPLAPNAPQSKPQAAIEKCSLTFTVGETPVSTPQPLACGTLGCNPTNTAAAPCQTGYICVPFGSNTGVCALASAQQACMNYSGPDRTAACCTAPTPTPTAVPKPDVICGQKTAAVVKTSGALDPVNAGDPVAGGATIEYKLTINADYHGLLGSEPPTGPDFVIEDTLDPNTTWVGSTTPATVGTVEPSGGKIKITLKPFTGVRTVTYKVLVATKQQAFNFKNSAKVVDNGYGVGGSICSVSLKTVPVGEAICDSKTAYTKDADGTEHTIADNGAVKAGDTFYYRIKVSAASETKGAVTVKDVLPANITFLESANQAGSPEIAQSTDSSGRTVLTTNLGVMGQTATNTSADQKTVSFKVKMSDSIDTGTFKNTATITTENGSNTSTCDQTVKVLPVGVAECTNKQMYNISYAENPNIDKIADGSNWSANDTFYYRFKVSSTKTTKADVKVTDILPASLQFVSSSDFKASGSNYVATIPAFSGEKIVEMKVKVKDGYQGTQTNTASTSTGDSSGSSCISNFNIPVYACNTSCDNDDQCHKSSPDFSCVPTNNGGDKRCRRTNNTGSESCQQPSSTPTPTPSVGCNNTCVTNADCTNPSHICYQTSNGGRCRLDSNVTSTTCSGPVASSSTPAPGQPVPPKQLPVTGPADWANWLKAGLVTLGIGSILLLLL